MRKGSILCVDDDELVLQTEAEMLEKLGYDVITATNPAKAIEIFRQQHDQIILVIADVVMPEIPGDALAREVHSISPDTPIVLTTGHTDLIKTDLSEKMVAIGVKRIAAKPLTTSELQEVVAEALREEAHADT